MTSSNYRCKACDAFLAFGPLDLDRLRQIKYRHDFQDCPDHEHKELRLHGAGTPVLFFDTDAWAKQHASEGVLDAFLCLNIYVGPAVPK